MKLIPSNGTFELAETIEKAVRCTKQLFSEGRRLIVHPFPIDLCTHIISDSHWLMENLLCLISNAVKYSDAGDCDIRFEFVAVADLLNSPRGGHDEGSVVAIESPPPADLRSTHSFYDDDSRDITHHIKITVEDRGIGIACEKRKTLFGIFRQAQRSAGGTGLGLFRYIHPNLDRNQPDSIISNQPSTIFLLSLTLNSFFSVCMSVSRRWEDLAALYLVVTVNHHLAIIIHSLS